MQQVNTKQDYGGRAHSGVALHVTRPPKEKIIQTKLRLRHSCNINIEETDEHQAYRVSNDFIIVLLH